MLLKQVIGMDAAMTSWDINATTDVDFWSYMHAKVRRTNFDSYDK